MVVAETVLSRVSEAPPGFVFGEGAQTLAMMGGGLILDSGEAENTFPFRCQDRFLVYTSLLGLRSVLLTLDDAHETRLRALVSDLGLRLRALAQLQGVMPVLIPEPLYVRCSLVDLRLSAGRGFGVAARALAESGQPVTFVTNQVSPTTARMLGELASLLRATGVDVNFDAASCERVSALAIEWHNKARFLALRPELSGCCGLRWVSSTVLSASEVLSHPHWPMLSRLAIREWESSTIPQEIFLKSAQDSSGNVSAIVSSEHDVSKNPSFVAALRRWLQAKDFASQAFVRELRGECEASPSLEGTAFDDALLTSLRNRQAAMRRDIQLIAQPVLRPPSGAEGKQPASIGISIRVGDRGAARLIAANAQLYRDEQRREFVGTFLDEHLLANAAVARFAQQCVAAAEVLGGRGWRGPVNFDGCLGDDGSYWFAGDCNPRLTALYAPLAMRTWLGAIGVKAQSVVSYGYRGEVAPDDPASSVDTWAASGLLFRADEGRGMLVLPNMARRRGHDLLAINLDRAEAGDRMKRMRTLMPSVVPPHLEALYG